MEKKQRGSESKAKQELGWGVLRQSPAKDTVRSHFPAPFAGLASRRRWWRWFHPSRDSDCSNKERPGDSRRWDTAGKWKYLSASWQSEGNFYWQIPVGKITAESKCFIVGDERWAHSERKGEGRRELGGQMRGLPPPSPNEFKSWISSGFWRTRESSWWFRSPLLTLLWRHPHCYLFVTPRTSFCFNKWPKSQHTRVHGCYFVVL